MEKVKEKQQNIVSDNKFLGTERVGKLLCKFAIPCVLSLVIQALYNIVDQLFIGNCATLGDLGNTATGIVYPLTVIALAIGLLIGDGSAACISINQGKNQTKDTHKTIGTALVAGLAIGLLLMGISFGLCDQILTGFGANEATFAFAKEYSTWIIAGFPFFILTTLINPIIRADGSPKFAMFSIAIGAVVNIALDPLFIFGFNMGMTGAALATFIAQVVSCLISIGYLFKSKSFKLKLKSFIPNFKLMFSSLKLGVSSFLTQIAIVIITVINNNILISYMPGDPSAIGLLTIAFKVFGIIISVAIGVAAGGQPILGYNYGAKNYDRVKQAFKLIVITTAIVGAVATVFFVACPQLIFKMFGSTVTTFGINCFRIYMSLVLITCLIKAVSIFFQAIGMPVKSTLIGLLRDFVFIVPLAILLPLWGGMELFMWSAPISDVLTLAVTTGLLVSLFKQINSKAKEKPEQKQTVVIEKSVKGKIITISREHGAGGREIGQKLAEKLGIPFYDKEIAMIAAEKSGLAEEFINEVEDKTSALYTLYLSTDVNQVAISAQAKALKQIAENGACVVVGRAADHVLKDYDLCKIHIYAPIEYKLKRIMNNYGDNEQQAQNNIEKADKRRAKFYKNVTGKTWGAKENYDLSIDSSIGVEKTVETIVEYLKK